MPIHPQRHQACRGPRSNRLLTLGLTPIAALPLGACDPAHEGQLGAEPTGVSTRTDPSGSPALSTTPPPIPSATPSATTRTVLNVTISNNKTGTWHRQDDILKQPTETSSDISQAYNFDTEGCLAIIFYKANQSINSKRKRGGDNTISSVKVRQTMPNHTSFVVTSGSTPVEAIPDALASTDAWHQFLSSTRVAGLDAGVMG